MADIIEQSKTGNKAPTLELSRLRGQQAAMYKLKGFTYQTVLRMINDDAETKHWGKIGMSQLKKDIAKYINFTLDYDSRDLKEVLEGEKLMYVAEVDRNYETVYSLVMRAINYYQHEEENKKKKEQRPVITRGQIPWMIDLLTKIGDHLAKIKGWDSSGGNKINILNLQNNEFDINARAREDLANLEPEVAKEFKTLLDSLTWKDDESTGLVASEGMGGKQSSDGKQEVEVSKS